MNEMEFNTKEMVVVSLRHSLLSRYLLGGFETNI